MDSTRTLPQVVEGSNAVLEINELHDAMSPAAFYGRNAAESVDLTWGYIGASRWGSFDIADGTQLLGVSTTTYMVVAKASGVVSFATSTTNWNNSTDYCRAYKIVTGLTAVTSYEDYRGGPGGTLSGSGGGGGTAIVETVNAGTGIVVDDSDAANPIVSVKNAVTALSIASGVVNIDCALGSYFTLALNANVTSITFSNLPGSGKGASIAVRITQDSSPRTVAWPASFKWEGGVPVSVSTGSGVVDLLVATTFDNGSAWQPTMSKDRS